MDYIKGRITKLLVDFFGNDYRRITHALDVMKHAENIMEHTEGCDYEVLIAAALLHDVGIKRSEEILGYNNGKTQEEIRASRCGTASREHRFRPGENQEVSEIIGNHHSPSRYEYVELKILKEADRIVNRLEGD